MRTTKIPKIYCNIIYINIECKKFTIKLKLYYFLKFVHTIFETFSYYKNQYILLS